MVELELEHRAEPGNRGRLATRRTVLKGALAAGASVVWAVPVVEAIASGRAGAVSGVSFEPYATTCTGPATLVAFQYSPSANNFQGVVSGPSGVSITKAKGATEGVPNSGSDGPPSGGKTYSYSDEGLVFGTRGDTMPTNGTTGDGASGVLSNIGEPPSPAWIVLSTTDGGSAPYFVSGPSGSNLGSSMKVTAGEILYVDPNGNIFLRFQIYSVENGAQGSTLTLCQDLVVHVSCSDPAVQPATENVFQIGSLLLVDFVPGSGPGSTSPPSGGPTPPPPPPSGGPTPPPPPPPPPPHP